MLIRKLFLCSSVLPALAFAQGVDPFDAEVASVIILQDKSVQKEIGVTEAQRAKMNKFADQHQAAMKLYEQELRSKQKKGENVHPDPTRIEKMVLTMKKGVFAQLSGAQLKRLREISLQQVGWVALVDETVAKRIGISSSQLTTMRATYKAGITRADELAQGAQKALDAQLGDLKKQNPKNDAERKKLEAAAQARAKVISAKVDPKIDAIRLDTRKKLLAMLSSTQKQAWTNLQGKPFKPKS